MKKYRAILGLAISAALLSGCQAGKFQLPKPNFSLPKFSFLNKKNDTVPDHPDATLSPPSQMATPDRPRTPNSSGRSSSIASNNMLPGSSNPAADSSAPPSREPYRMPSEDLPVISDGYVADEKEKKPISRQPYGDWNNENKNSLAQKSNNPYSTGNNNISSMNPSGPGQSQVIKNAYVPSSGSGTSNFAGTSQFNPNDISKSNNSSFPGNNKNDVNPYANSNPGQPTDSISRPSFGNNTNTQFAGSANSQTPTTNSNSNKKSISNPYMTDSNANPSGQNNQFQLPNSNPSMANTNNTLPTQPVNSKTQLTNPYASTNSPSNTGGGSFAAGGNSQYPDTGFNQIQSPNFDSQSTTQNTPPQNNYAGNNLLPPNTLQSSNSLPSSPNTLPTNTLPSNNMLPSNNNRPGNFAGGNTQYPSSLNSTPSTPRIDPQVRTASLPSEMIQGQSDYAPGSVRKPIPYSNNQPQQNTIKPTSNEEQIQLPVGGGSFVPR